MYQEKKKENLQEAYAGSLGYCRRVPCFFCPCATMDVPVFLVAKRPIDGIPLPLPVQPVSPQNRGLQSSVAGASRPMDMESLIAF